MDKGTIAKNNKDLKWTLLSEIKDSKVDKLFEVYAEDKEKARIFYFLNKPTCHFLINRTVLFESENGDFRFARMVEKIGISSTGKMYISKKTIEAISYNKKSGFYHFDNTNGRGGYMKQLNYLSLHNFSRHLCNDSFDDEMNGVKNPNPVLDYMIEKFGWIRYVAESNFWGITFNVIKRKKLFNLKAMYRHIYGCPYPQAKIVHEYTMSNSGGKYLQVWKEQRKYIYNIENLKVEFFNNPLFSDSCRMAQMVGKKVNCSWSEKRLKSEHDNWAKAITQVLLETEELRELKIKEIFHEFAEHSGFEMLLTNHALLEEGVRMNHCVGTYSGKVDIGQCAIYRAFGCTLELVLYNDILSKDGNPIKLRIGQYMNIGNTRAPQESWNYVNEMLDRFEPSLNSLFLETSDSLPF